MLLLLWIIIMILLSLLSNVAKYRFKGGQVPFDYRAFIQQYFTNDIIDEATGVPSINTRGEVEKIWMYLSDNTRKISVGQYAPKPNDGLISISRQPEILKLIYGLAQRLNPIVQSRTVSLVDAGTSTEVDFRLNLKKYINVGFQQQTRLYYPSVYNNIFGSTIRPIILYVNNVNRDSGDYNLMTIIVFLFALLYEENLHPSSNLIYGDWAHGYSGKLCLTYLQYILLAKYITPNEFKAIEKPLNYCILVLLRIQYGVGYSDIEEPNTPTEIVRKFNNDFKRTIQDYNKPYLVNNPFKSKLKELQKEGYKIEKELNEMHPSLDDKARFHCVKNRIKNQIKES